MWGTQSISVRLRASTVAVSAGTRNHFSFYRIYGLTLSPREKWYSLSNKLVARNVSQFVEGKFFQLFRSEICRLQVGNILRENGDHVPKFGGSNLPVAGHRLQVIVSPIQKVS